MTKKSSIFLRNISVVDCAIVYPDGTIHGHSFHPNFIVTGDVDEQEQVVIDFSRCKKEIKNALDDFDIGYDHKCWLIAGYSQYKYILDIDTSHDMRAILKTDAYEADTPVHVYRVIANPNQYSDVSLVIQNSIAEHVQEHLRKIWPSVTVDVELTAFMFAATDKHYCGSFNYFHGLPQSSSTKCRRFNHGHGSFYEFDFGGEATKDVVLAAHQIMSPYLDCTFVDENNIKSETDTWLEIEATDIGGDFYNVKINKDKINIIRMPFDSTIENIVEFIVSKHGEQFRELGIKRFFASEGLAKGAMKVL